MTTIREVIAEFVGMFVGDARLTLALLAIVAVAALTAWTGLDPLVCGAILLGGSLLALIENVWRAARR